VGHPSDVLAGERDRFELASAVTATVIGFDPDYQLTELAHPAGTLHLAGRVGQVGRQVRVTVKAVDVTLALPPAPVTTAQT
ncbi:hypothetical protein J8J27_34120, partial [Mycobacterium tuberculosis]|nr:hypothetical protein [Mycobacterium tuberculosis]